MATSLNPAWKAFLTEGLTPDVWLLQSNPSELVVEKNNLHLTSSTKKVPLKLTSAHFLQAALISPYTIMLSNGLSLQALHHAGAPPYNLKERLAKYQLDLRTDGSSVCLAGED